MHILGPIYTKADPNVMIQAEAKVMIPAFSWKKLTLKSELESELESGFGGDLDFLSGCDSNGIRLWILRLP